MVPPVKSGRIRRGMGQSPIEASLQASGDRFRAGMTLARLRWLSRFMLSAVDLPKPRRVLG